MNAKELIADVLTKMPKGYVGITDPDPQLHARKLAHAYAQLEALLALRYPCKKCKGEKVTLGYNDNANRVAGICPLCHGTGQGEPVLAIRAEEQMISNEIYGMFQNKETVNYLIRLLLSDGWVKTVKDGG
jgi:hypothetical protein